MKFKYELVMKNLKWIIALLMLIIFIQIVIALSKDSIVVFDNFCYDKLSLLISDRMTFFVKLLTNFGSAFALIGITLLIMLLFKNKKYGILTGINLVVVFLLNLLLKLIFARPRPMDINLIEESGYSFPSGHAMVSTAFYGFLIYLILKSSLSKSTKLIYSILLILLIVFICITRVYLGVHYASDVLGGLIISILYTILFTSVVIKYLQK